MRLQRKQKKEKQKIKRKLPKKSKKSKKLKDVLGILKSVAKKDPSLIQTVTTRGSHVSFHGTTGVETIAKPHGGRTDIASGIVNRMLAKLLGVDPRDSN